MLWALHTYCSFSFSYILLTVLEQIRAHWWEANPAGWCRGGFLGLGLEWVSSHYKMPGANRECGYQNSMPTTVSKVRILEN